MPPREGYIDHLRSGYFGWVGFNIGSPPLTPGGYVSLWPGSNLLGGEFKAGLISLSYAYKRSTETKLGLNSQPTDHRAATLSTELFNCI